MAKHEISGELFNLLNSLLSFISVIYKLYRPYFKFLLLAVVALVAFRLGRSSIVDSLDRSVNRLKNILRNRAEYSIFLPQKIVRVVRIRNIILWVLVLSAAAFTIVYSLKVWRFKKGKVRYAVGYALSILVVLVTTWVYEVVLSVQLKQGRARDTAINEQLYSLQQQMGPRVEGLLRIFLCKEQITKRPSRPRGICIKEKCKNYRQTLKQKVQTIQSLVMGALKFQWCSVCKRKMPLQQYLQFQPQIYPSGQQPDEEQQILGRNQFLFGELMRMTDWAKQLAPCNCSQIYWREQLRCIKGFKKQQKQIDQRLLIYQRY